MNTRPIRPRRVGFTLVEMLVVIVILGILAALITGVAVQVQRSARQAVIKIELDQIAAAFKAYKNKYGEYPPNFTTPDDVRRHFRKAFPRMDSVDNGKLDDLLAMGLQPDEALVFWLGGFSDNPARPLSGPGGPMCGDESQRRTQPLIDALAGKTFSLASPPADEKLLQLDIQPSRFVAGGDSNAFLWRWRPAGYTQPYIYFNTSRGATAVNYGGITPIEDADGNLVEPKSFQILSAGLDDDWGSTSPPIFPDGPVTAGWKDNLANFSTRNFEDSVP